MANTDPESGKRSAAKKAVSYVRDGMLIGLGTGSTTQYFLKYLSEEVKNGLDISGIPTSRATEKMARKLGIKISKLTRQQIDIDFDGADEVDTKGNMIKGGGGALTREKIVA
ncbi:MAG: ribose 5-phosphate isomerase A, partial [Candidatus Thermoplasmatota archaeon]|nr:ribose 5-phosphate isomerase A [Candidatus Thermoplasmatota archaeon]